MAGRRVGTESRAWCADRISVSHEWPQDWEGIAQERVGGWECAVRQRQVQAQLPRPRSAWRRYTGNGLMRLGVWLTRLGATVADKEQPARVPVARY